MGPKKIWDAAAQSSNNGNMVDPEKYTFPHLCYRAKFCHSRSNCSSIDCGDLPEILTLPFSLLRLLKVIRTDTGDNVDHYRSPRFTLGLGLGLGSG